MKRFFAILLVGILSQSGAYADEKAIEGVVSLPKVSEESVPKGGVLFVIARPLGTVGGPPTAVVKVDHPKFPQKFRLTPADTMLVGTPFNGPFRLTARFSPNGDATRKDGAWEGQTDERTPIKVGTQNVKIELKAPQP